MRNIPIWTKTHWPSAETWKQLLDPYAEEIIAQAYADIQNDEILKEVKSAKGTKSITALRNRCAAALFEEFGE